MDAISRLTLIVGLVRGDDLGNRLLDLLGNNAIFRLNHLQVSLLHNDSLNLELGSVTLSQFCNAERISCFAAADVFLEPRYQSIISQVQLRDRFKC